MTTWWRAAQRTQGCTSAALAACTTASGLAPAWRVLKTKPFELEGISIGPFSWRRSDRSAGLGRAPASPASSQPLAATAAPEATSSRRVSDTSVRRQADDEQQHEDHDADDPADEPGQRHAGAALR